MLLRVDATTPKTRTRTFVATCVSLMICAGAGASCGKGADAPRADTSTSQNPTVAQPTGGPSSSRSTASTSIATGHTDQGASASNGRASTAGVGAAGDTATSGANANSAGNPAASASAGSSGAAEPPSDPGVPPEVVKAWTEWPLPGKDYNNSRYTQDSTINSTTVGTLKEAWTVSLGGFAVAYGMCSTVPIVIDGTVYVEDTQSGVRAIDLASGTVKWSVQGSGPNPGPNGVAVGWGKVFAISGSDSVVAYDVASGRQLWTKRVVDTSTAGIDIQPTVFDNQVLVSTVPISLNGIYTGGDRGILKALKQDTGEERWRFDTIESSADVWSNSSVNSGGGSWYPPAIDLVSGRIFWAVANPAPFPGTADFPNGSSRPGQNLYSDSTLVLDVRTGTYQWHHQTVQHDLFDRDLLHTMLTEVGGVPIVVSTGKEGRVWANRRDNGEVLWGPVSVGMHKNDELTELKGMTQLLPGSFGGVLTPPALADGVVYVAELNAPSMYTSNETAYFGSETGSMQGDLVAINAATGDILWDVLIDGDPTGGMTVVNDLVITATFQGNVVAYQRETGKEVWRWKAPGGINAWMSVVGDTIVIPIGSSDPPSVVALRLSGAGASSAPTGSAGSAAASGSAANPETSSASFSAIYREILAKRCAGPVCHSGKSTGGSLNVMGTDVSAARAALIDRPASGSECSSSGLPLVTAGQPDKSLLYLKVAGMPPCGSRMPPTGALPQAEIDRLRTWIANGAAND